MGTYLLIGIFVGVIEIIDGIILYRASGKIDAYSTTTSLIEFCWFFVTIYYLLSYEFSTIGLIIAVGYLSYNITGWIAVYITIKTFSSIEEIETMIVPYAYVISGIIFGFIYSAACFVAINAI